MSIVDPTERNEGLRNEAIEPVRFNRPGALTIHLPAEILDRLRREAMAAGDDLATHARKLLIDTLTDQQPSRQFPGFIALTPIDGRYTVVYVGKTGETRDDVHRRGRRAILQRHGDLEAVNQLYIKNMIILSVLEMTRRWPAAVAACIDHASKQGES